MKYGGIVIIVVVIIIIIILGNKKNQAWGLDNYCNLFFTLHPKGSKTTQLPKERVTKGLGVAQDTGLH